MITLNWITRADLELQFGIEDLPEDDNGNVSDQKINEAIDAGVTFVESYLRSINITLPASQSIQDELRYFLLDIVRYNYSNNTGSVTAEIRTKYEDAIAYLNKVLKGSVKLSDDNATSGWTTMRIYRT